jgi:hypothetical protein
MDNEQKDIEFLKELGQHVNNKISEYSDKFVDRIALANRLSMAILAFTLSAVNEDLYQKARKDCFDCLEDLVKQYRERRKGDQNGQ